MFQTFPPVSIYGNWIEEMEVRALDDNGLVDLSDATEITLKLKDPANSFDEMTLTMTNGDITVTGTGIIEWNVPQAQMGMLIPKLYKLVITIKDVDGDTQTQFIGPISIVE